MPSLHRIKPQLRPLRPPLSKSYRATRARFFARDPHLNTLATNATRPQLSFLLHSSRHPIAHRTLVARLLSTETKAFLKQQAQFGIKFSAFLFILGASGLWWIWMLTQELVDRDFPAPKSWSFLSKVLYHCARGQEVPNANKYGIVEWWSVGCAYLDLKQRLEEVEGVDEKVKEGSYEDRRGYWECLMGCARAAMHLEDYVRDTSRNLVFREEQVLKQGMKKPKKVKNAPNPREEDCVPAFPRPDEFWVKVLETEGFTAREKLEAALEYGSYLDYKGRHTEAEVMLQRAQLMATYGVAPATKPLPLRLNGVIPANTPVTPNILDATTALAIHYAQTGATEIALPIFLSLLRARREAPTSTPITQHSQPPSGLPRTTKSKRTDIDAMNDALEAFWSLLQASKFPPPPPTGNEPYTKTPENLPDEAALMAYIGEVLFASASSTKDKKIRDIGYSWTKSAIEMAWAAYNDGHLSREARVKSIQVLSMAVRNRSQMLSLQLSPLQTALRVSKSSPSYEKYIPGTLAWNISSLKSQEEQLEKERKEAKEFETVLHRGGVLETKEEGLQVVWGADFLKEFVVSRMVGVRWSEKFGKRDGWIHRF